MRRATAGVFFVPRLRLSDACGVGSNPQAFAVVRRANVGSSQHTPSRIEPERGHVTEDASKSASNESWGVLHEDVARSNLANDASELGPEAGAFSVDTCALAGDADVLAGKAARNHVNNSSPRSSVKGANVIPNRERREKAVILSGDKYACGVGVEFDGADGSPSEQVAAENAATSACE
jgi:hypothetical protein